MVYAGERLAVNKDRFIIGRGKQSSDLTIKDPNVSRQHAMIEFQNGDNLYLVGMSFETFNAETDLLLNPPA